MQMQINWPIAIWYEFLLKGIAKQTMEKTNALEFVVKYWKNMQEKVLFDQNQSILFFKDFDQKPQDLLLSKSQGLFWPKDHFWGCICYPFNF